MHYLKKIALLITITALYLSPLHATILGQIIIADRNSGSRVLVYERINDYAVVEGDILIAKMRTIEQQGAIITKRIHGSRWPQGIIAFEVDEKLPFKNKFALYQAIDHWQQSTNIEFVELTSTNRNQYPDYISFIPAPGTICASYVGRKGGKQEINLSPRCTMMNTVHEIGHALGLWHEQSRADRDSYIKILWENIAEDHKYNFNQHLHDGKDFGAYDYSSIMHYGPNAFSKNGEKTIVPLIEEITIGQRNQLSNHDIAAINAMYPEV